jgi:hypothetical protein
VELGGGAAPRKITGTTPREERPAQIAGLRRDCAVRRAQDWRTSQRLGCHSSQAFGPSRRIWVDDMIECLAWILALAPPLLLLALSERQSNRSKIWLRWLTILSTLAAGVVLALFYSAQSWTIGVRPLWAATAEGTVNLSPLPEPTPQRFQVHLERSEEERILRVEPYYESGWGCPSQALELRLYDPQGSLLAWIPRGTVFQCWCIDTSGCGVWAARFLPETRGTYSLWVTPLSPHMGYIQLSVLEDAWARYPFSRLLR